MRHVLEVFGQHERAAFQNFQDAAAAGGVGDEKMLGNYGAEGPAADHNGVESRAGVPTVCPVLSIASCRVLHRNRPILSRVKWVLSEVSGAAMTGASFSI